MTIALGNLKRDIEAAGVMDIRDALHTFSKNVILSLKTDYSVTFEDPLKPSGTAYKRLMFASDASFRLIGVRKTDKNFIFQFKPHNDSAVISAERHGSGPGLSRIPEIAEFTMKQMNDERLHATSFLTAVKEMITEQARNEEWISPEVEIDRGNLWGSW